MLMDAGLVFLSDSRTNAGVDQINTFRKTTVFERPGDRVIVLLSAGNLAISQGVLNLLAPARGDVLIARGRVVRAGRTITVCQADGIMRSGNEETTVATMLATIMTVIERPEVTG